MRHERFGSSSEHSAKLDQLELQLAELVEKAAEAKTAEAIAAPAPAVVDEARKPARRPLPEALRRERRVHEGPAICPCCRGTVFRKLGEDATETLERVPAQWKVIVHVRGRLACRRCDTVLQAPAPTHPIARGRAGPQLLADVLYGKYGTHLPLNRQSVIYANEGVDLDVSTLADWVGASAATLKPLRDAIEAHVLRAERIHADDTTVPVLAKGKCRTGRLWAYVRDDPPFAGETAPAVLFQYSPTREAEHPEAHLASYSGLMQADAYGGYNGLYAAGRKPGPIVEAACWAHGRRKLFELAELQRGSRSKPYAASTPCSPSSARSSATRPISGWPCAGNVRARSSTRSGLDAQRAQMATRGATARVWPATGKPLLVKGSGPTQ